MKTGDTVWVHPFSNPLDAVAAHIDLLSSNCRSIALRLEDKPRWLNIMEGVFLHKQHGHIEMLLMRDKAAGPWVELVSGKQYDIAEVRP